MCGIAATLTGSPDNQEAEASVKRMVEAMRHRGPDAKGLEGEGRCILGHARLKVIDFSGGAQPMRSRDGRYLLSFNGEIFNFRDLRREMESAGIEHRTQSDTEVLLNHLIAHGREGLARLNGQYAFLFWDRDQQTLLAGRDQKGEKPLFWSRKPDGSLVFASEIKALLTLPDIDRTVSRDALSAYFRLNYIPPHRSVYAAIHPVRSGGYLECRWDGEGGWTTTEDSFWSPGLSTWDTARMSEVEIVERVRSSFQQAIGRSMIADAPLGAFLSGGLDSSTIVAAMAQQSGRQIKTFSVGFGKQIDELPAARAVADQYGADHTEVQMDLNVGELLERMVGIYDEPFADSSNIPTYAISEVARREVTVVLSGDGGDELFGGYRWYVPLLLGEKMSGSALEKACWNLAALATRLLCRVAGRYVPKDRRKAIAIARELNLKSREPDLWRRHLSRTAGMDRIISGFDDPDARERYQSDMAGAFYPPDHVESIDRATWFDFACYLQGDILKKVDMATMAVSLESRAPFLDQEFLELIFSLPRHHRFCENHLKPFMRRAFERDWPMPVRTRPKQGFGAPVEAWLRRPDVAELRARVENRGSALWQALPDRAPLLKRARGQEAWQLLTLGLWLERYPPSDIV